MTRWGWLIVARPAYNKRRKTAVTTAIGTAVATAFLDFNTMSKNTVTRNQAKHVK